MMRRYLAVPALAALLVATAGIGLPAEAQKPSGDDANADLVAKSQRLKDRAAPVDLNAGPYLETYAEIKAYADGFASTLPLPSDGSLDDVGLVAAADQGGTSASLLEFVMLNNLRCDWYAAALGDSSVSEVAKSIVGDVPRWGVFKNAEIAGDVARRSMRVAEGARVGDSSALEAELAGPNCNPAAAVRRSP